MDYPARLDIELPPTVARWRPLFNWVLAIPHFVIYYGLNIAGEVVAVISWFAILFTGKLPAGLADMQCMVQRYGTRVSTFVTGLHEQYPPFTFATQAADPGGYPAAITFQPALEGRNRLTCALRFIWIIPAAIVTMIIGIVAAVCWFVGALAVLFTGSWPAGLQAWVLKGLRASLRLNAYGSLLTDQYPPLSFD